MSRNYPHHHAPLRRSPESNTSFMIPLPWSGEKAEVPASSSRLWMARWALCWKFSLVLLQPLTLELQRHTTKQLDVLIISLDSNAAAIIVDQKKLQEGEPGKSTSRPAIQSFNQLHHLLLLLGDWSPWSERIPEAGPASASWMEKLGTNWWWTLQPLHHHHFLRHPHL